MKNFVNRLMIMIAVAIMAMVAGCAANKVAAPAEGNSTMFSSGEIEAPYEGLGHFVGKDGTLDQQGCWKEVERQNQTYYKKCIEEIEPEFSWKKCSMYSAVFFAIKENYWDKKGED